MPNVLREISGIVFYKGTGDTLYAEQDEEGLVFRFKLGDANVQVTRFGKKGDFEDISAVNNFIIMLRSDGVLFTFPITELQKKETDKVKIFEDLLPDGEYEGLASEDMSNKLYVLCKHCRNEKTNKWGGGTILQIDADGVLTPAGNFELDIKEIDEISHSRKISFHPSALAQNPLTKEWFILSSVNKMLVVADQNWKVKSVYPLNPSLFVQPEGIAFDRQQNLYISNEQGSSSAATILLFAHNKN
ncbi:MAG TPA: SdiA-regulated domain-containing protein [Puia sp.]|nr:SdiA-regulated domain-containing protein [Puia sp.]